MAEFCHFFGESGARWTRTFWGSNFSDQNAAIRGRFGPDIRTNQLAPKAHFDPRECQPIAERYHQPTLKRIDNAIRLNWLKRESHCYRMEARLARKRADFWTPAWLVSISETAWRWCQSDGNSSPFGAAVALGALAQAMSDCHSASAAERRSL